MSFLYMSFSAGCIVIFTVILRRFCKNILPVELFCGLWWLAMIRALVPFSIQSNGSIYNLKIFVRFLGNGLKRNLDLTISELAKWAQIRSVIFAICVTLIAIGVVFFIRYFMRIHKNCSEIEINSISMQKSEIMDGIENTVRPMKKMKVKVSDQVDSPVSYGFFHPVIIVPENLNMDDKETLRYIFLHESIHIKYLHYVWKIVSVIVVCVHWFNPCMWLLYFCLDKEMECFCDKKVMQILGEDKKELYAKSLINLAKWQKESPLLCNNFVKRNMLKERIIRIMKLKKTSRIMALTSLLIFSSAATAFATTDTYLEIKGEDADKYEIQITGVSDEVVYLTSDEEIDLELSYEEIEPYISQENITRVDRSIYVEDYVYKSTKPSPDKINATIKRNGYTYTGTLSYTHGEKTSAGTYIGYYSGTLYK